jgi:NTE family protein
MSSFSAGNSREIVPIFSGGGTRLPCYIGILNALRQLELHFSTVVGVSGGSIVAALLASGKSLAELKQLALETDFRQFRGFSLINLLRTGGLSSGDFFEQWIDQQLGGRTFADMELDLHVLATDINGGGPVVFNKKNTPDFKVSLAVRYSMSIPLMFSFKKFGDHIMTDGVVLSEDALHQDWSCQGVPVLCFRLKSESEFGPVRHSRLFPLKSYILMLIQTFMNAVSREYVHAQFWHNTVVINTGHISSVKFDMTSAEKENLYDIGYNTAFSVIPIKLKSYFLEN